MIRSAYPKTLASEPKVWHHLSQAQLDWAYDQANHAPNRAEVLDNIALKSELSRAQVPPPLRLAYGSEEIERLDWYSCGVNNAPVVFFVHGGAWKSGTANDNSLFVHWLMKLGCHVVIPDFDPVTSVGGDLAHVAQQVQEALFFTHQHCASHGADPQKIIVAGHSSGAHLSACMVSRNWRAMGLEATPVAGLLCCSGMYELEPVSLSARSQYVQFTPQVVQDLSPLRHLEAFQMPVSLLCGESESPEFIRQFEAFGEALLAKDTQNGADKAPAPAVLRVPGLNHFEILETLHDEHSVHAQALTDLIHRVRVS
jgi:arylformamidase